MEQENITPKILTKIIDLVQHSSACHLKYSVVLKKAFKNDNANELYTTFCKCLKLAFSSSYKEKNIYVERILNFSALFVASFKLPKNNADGDVLITDPILEDIFKFILELSNSANDSHRYWCSLFINKIFGEFEELSDELCQAVQETMLARLNDCKAAIRGHAIIALHRLQFPTDEEDQIIDNFCVILESDSNAKVRKQCLEKIALNKRSLPCILTRIRDVDEHVRAVAFQRVLTIAKYLKISQRRYILTCAICDTSDKIRNFTKTTLLKSWLESYDNDYLKLMKSVRFDACEEDVATTSHLNEWILEALLSSATIEDVVSCIKINDEKLMKYDSLDWESVLYYRYVIQYLRQSDRFEDILNDILPDLVNFCSYIKSYAEIMLNKEEIYELQYNFTLQQLFLITKGYDVSDATSRQCLNSLLYYMLHSDCLSVNTTKMIIENLENTISDVNSRSIFVCEIISNIFCGDDAKRYDEMERREKEKRLQISQLQSDISSLQEEENHFVVVQKNFSEAERVKTEIEEKQALLKEIKTVPIKAEDTEKKTDARTFSKILAIAEGLLLSPTIREFNAAISMLNSEVISQALVHQDDTVKIKALRCYGLLCVIDQKTAQYGIHLFSGLLFADNITDSEIIVISVKVIVDMLTLYGLGLIDKSAEENRFRESQEDKKVFIGGTSLTDLIQALAEFLQHEDPKIEDIATKGICILLMYNVTSSSLLSRLIIKWANPATENSSLKKFIGLTLNELIMMPTCHLFFADAVISTIRTIAYAPRGSPLLDIDFDNMIKFMVTLCQMPTNGVEIHTEIGLKICSQMLEKPRAKVNFYFSRVLPRLVAPVNDDLDELLTLCDELLELQVIKDVQILRNINKFKTMLTKKVATDEDHQG